MLHGEILLYLQASLSEQLVIKGVFSLGATSGKKFLAIISKTGIITATGVN
jgi:hypothetical protein